MRPVRSPLQYLDHEHTFTAGMAKREGPLVFAGAPIVQGRWDGTGTPDALTFPRGNEVIGSWYDNFDPEQGSISFWITPEWDGNDGLLHEILRPSGNFVLYKDNASFLILYDGTTFVAVNVAGWTAGTTYSVIARWGFQNTLDGTNYVCISVDGVHAFGAPTAGSVTVPAVALWIGSLNGTSRPADAIIEGLTIYRRVLYDGEFGVDANGVDEINAIWAAGVGADPTLITGSWDVVFCLPTDSAVGALVTGAGEAWSHPHSSNVPHQFFMHDGYHGGNHNAVQYNATTTDVNCGSALVLDNIPAADFTFDCWVKLDSRGEGSLGRIFDKGNFLLFCGADLRISAIHAGTTASADIPFSYDGKWHHVMAVWDVGTLTFEHFFLDGRDLIQDVVVGVGAYSGDAANDLHIGNDAGTTRTLDGAMAWFRFSDNKRNVADFIAPRLFPAADGNTIEAWSFDDGAGATIVAQVATPGNDGTLANGTWITPWAEEGTPLSVQGIEFDGADTSVLIPDAVALQDLHAAAFTAEAWVRADGLGEGGTGQIFNKTNGLLEGWYLGISASGVTSYVYAASNAYAFSGADEYTPDAKLHHICMQFDKAGDQNVYLWLDGIPVASYDFRAAAAGAIVTDVGHNLFLGNRSGAARTWDGLLGGWCRISNILRYTAGEAFVPPAPTNPPALPDANTVWQTDYSDGAGAVLTDDSATASNGVITIGAGRWWNTRDANLNDAGEMPFGAGGYMFGTDAANEGIEQTWAGLVAGENYVVRAIVFPTADGNFYPRLQIYDETNAGIIVTFDGPRYTGAHTGANDLATLIDAGARWPQSLVGATVYNITDESLGVITAISGDGTIITAALGGGTEDDWDTGDVYRIVWAVATDPINDGYWRHPWIETFCFELPTIARNGVGADCISISARVMNANTVGTLVCGQVELLENLLDNPSLETGVLVPPWIADGWGNVGLDAGDTQASTTGGNIIHSGVEAIQFNAGAATFETMTMAADISNDAFAMLSFWTYGIGRLTESNYDLQATGVGAILTGAGANWSHIPSVVRNTGNGQVLLSGNAAVFYCDDVYLVQLTNVILTVTPASEANSAESGGIRVDGYDSLTQPVNNRLKARSGHIIWRGRPRHNPANVIAFRDAAQVRFLDARGDGINYAQVLGTAVNTAAGWFNDGGGLHQQAWAAAAAWLADEELFWEFYWRGHFMQLSVAGIPVVTINQPVDFATLINTLNWGSQTGGIRQADIVIKEP